MPLLIGVKVNFGYLFDSVFVGLVWFHKCVPYTCNTKVRTIAIGTQSFISIITLSMPTSLKFVPILVMTLQ